MADNYKTKLQNMNVQLSNLPLSTDIEKLVAFETYKISELVSSEDFGTHKSISDLLPLLTQYIEIIYKITMEKVSNPNLRDIVYRTYTIILSGGKDVG